MADAPANAPAEVTRRRGRPRSTDVHDALLAAARELMTEVGYDRLSLEGVAERAGSTKTAIYRRWAGKAELVVAATEQVYRPPATPDTGSLREDLLACGREYVQEPGPHGLLAALLVAMPHDDRLRDLARSSVGAPYASGFQDVITRAVSNGTARPDADVAVLAGVFPAIAFRHVVVEQRPVDAEMVRQVVDGCLLPALVADEPTANDRARER